MATQKPLVLIAGQIKELSTGDTTSLFIGAAVSGGGANRVLYEDGSQNLAASNKFLFDGSDLSLVNPTAASGGTPSQPSPYFHLNGASWSGSASVNARARMYVSPTYNAYGSGPKLVIDFDRGEGFGGGGGVLSYGNPGTDYLTARLTMGNPSASGQGGILEATYDGNFSFKNMSAALSGLQPGYISWGGGSVLGYQSIRAHSTWGTILQAANGSGVIFKNPESGFGANVPVQFEPDIHVLGTAKIGMGTTSPSAQLHIISITEQFRSGYDASNYFKATVGSTGGVTLDAVGSGASFTFSDDVNINGEIVVTSTITPQIKAQYDASNRLDVSVSSAGVITLDAVGSAPAFIFSDDITLSGHLTLADAKNIILNTTTGTKIGTATSQKLGFFNATPVTQRTNIGILTDNSTGGNLGTVEDVSAMFDRDLLNDNFASIAAKINAIEQVLQDLGLTT